MSNDVTQGDAVRLAHRIGSEIAAVHAQDVDRNARFPAESIAALKEAKLLSALVPVELGGMGMGMMELTAICTALGQYCAASAMVFAMHQIQVACIVRHGLGSEFFRAYCRELVERQMLIGSITSEVGIGGDTRSSICAVQIEGDAFVLDKDATTISYGAQADDLLVTCRRDAGAARSDQIMVLARKGQFTLKQTSQWDTLGMRGTCSDGFRLEARDIPVEQILPKPFAEIAAQSMLASSHLLWSSVWFGIANSAVDRARTFVQAEARRQPSQVPPTALRLAEVSNALQAMRSAIVSALRRYEDAHGDADTIGSIGFSVMLNNLKTTASEMAVDIVQRALSIVGLAGYKNGTPFSLGRPLRDILSAPLMIGNDRILANTAKLLLVQKGGGQLMSA